MDALLSVGEALSLNARLFPDKIGARDLVRSLTYRQWNERACRLANALLGMGLVKGDRVAVLAYNCVEWLEIYAALAKAGLVAVPVNFRLVGPEIRYIVENAEAGALIVQADLFDRVESIRDDLAIGDEGYIHFGSAPLPSGWRAYEDLIGAAAAREPDVPIFADDPLALMYTSGTTGKPKGAIRTHGATVLLSLMIDVELGFVRDDTVLLVMPMCHANSLFFTFAFAYFGASCCVYDRHGVEPEHLLRALTEQRCTFTSLVPTHYIMMLGLPEAVRQKYDTRCVNKLLISSAPAREVTKLAIMEQFRNSSLFEMYGSTEAGWVTVLRPDEQFSKLGSIGRELAGTGRVRLLDDAGVEVPDGEVGELYSRTPYAFQGYWKLPDKSAEAFRGAYCTVGDMARFDADGYLHLVDRKKNVIISGGENIYPSEIEGVVASHPKVMDVAVIGVPHDKWGESVHAVVVARDGQRMTEQEIHDWCIDKMAGYKRPRSVAFIREEDMPRTATGKILHRVLRDRYAR